MALIALLVQASPDVQQRQATVNREVRSLDGCRTQSPDDIAFKLGQALRRNKRVARQPLSSRHLCVDKLLRPNKRREGRVAREAQSLRLVEKGPARSFLTKRPEQPSDERDSRSDAVSISVCPYTIIRDTAGRPIGPHRQAHKNFTITGRDARRLPPEERLKLYLFWNGFLNCQSYFAETASGTIRLICITVPLRMPSQSQRTVLRATPFRVT